MKYLFASLVLLSGCTSWHWGKEGASAADYAVDEKFCKQQVYSGTDGMVTKAHVRRMSQCLESRGWRRVDN